LLRTHQERALWAEHDLLQGVQEVLLADLVLFATRRQERRLVYQVPQARAREPWCPSREHPQVHVVRERHAPCVHLEDSLAANLVREVDSNAPVEAPGPEKSLVEHVGLVGGGQKDHTLLIGEAVHLGEDLVEGLLLLARSPDSRLAAGASYGVKLVDE